MTMTMTGTMTKVYRVILGSKSPRRQELLRGMDIDFEVMTADTDESYPKDIANYDIPEYLSHRKMEAIRQLPLPDNYLIITADTLVFADGEVMGKPHDKEEAKLMLQNLSDKIHEVVTGVIVATASTVKSFSSLSRVHFAKLDDNDIEHYIEKYKPFDKAGAYGIQEWIGYIGITGIEGSFYNVMGLPTQKLYSVLKGF